MPDMLNITGLTVRYGVGVAVDRIDLSLMDSGVGALLGANGAGKSSVLRAIAGLTPATGKITFAGQPIEMLGYRQRFRMGIVYVPEGRAIVPDLSVAENLTLGGYFETAATRRRRRDMVLEWFPEIANRLHAPAGLMSGGEQQMLAIGRAMMSAPKLLLLDEPSLGLAPQLVTRVMERLAGIQRDAQLAALLVEQSLHTAAKVAQHAWFLRQGRIAGTLSAQQLRSSDAREQAINVYLGA